jgi:hypothetical protein
MKPASYLYALHAGSIFINGERQMTKTEALNELQKAGASAVDVAEKAGKGSVIEISAEAMAFAHQYALDIVERIDSLD